MSSSKIKLFADTNLLLQCKPLEELDWSDWKPYDEVCVVISKPVLREIDYRKNKGNDRVGKRARKANELFRQLLSTDGKKLIRESSPRVLLSVEPDHLENEELESQLNYQERDDQLIGIIYEYSQKNSNVEARLLTHDTNPVYTAKAVGIRYDLIPDSWLLPPESNETEKKLRKLEEENRQLKKTEPEITIRSINHENEDVDSYDISFTQYEALTDEEIHALMERLEERFPIATNFDPDDYDEKRILPDDVEYIPASDEQISKYNDEDYPNWLSNCRNKLETLHTVKQRHALRPSFDLLAENVGTRPAVDALITIRVSGNIRIKPPSVDNDPGIEGQSLGKQFSVALPSPPRVPRGKMRKTKRKRNYSTLSTLEQFQRAVNLGMPSLANFDVPRFNPPNVDPVIYQPDPHDPNAFYYKPNRPDFPQDTYSLECDQWRHLDGKTSFSGEFYFVDEQPEIRGALSCEVQAANMSRPIKKQVPVRITITKESVFDEATDAIEELEETPGLQLKGSRLVTKS